MKQVRLRFLILSTVFACFPPWATPWATGGLTAEPPAPGAITETILSNGLRVVMRPMRANPVVCTTVLVRAGVAWEPEGLSGASHFLEHLLFNGTDSRTQEELYADVDRIGGYNNATTRADHTLYLLLVPSDQLDRALEIQADMLFHSTLPPEKFEKEKGIVLEELGKDTNDPTNLATMFFEKHLWEGCPYARPVLGSVQSISSLKREDVLAYYHDRYQPQRMILFLAGDFDPREALARVREHFGSPPASAQKRDPDTQTPSARATFHSAPQVFHQRLEAGRTYVRAAFSAPGEADPDVNAFGLLASIVSDGNGSPLGRVLRGGTTPATYDFSLGYDTVGSTGIMTLSASLTGAVEAREVVRRTLTTLVNAPRDGRLDPASLRRLRERQRTEEATLGEQVHYYAMFRAPRLLHGSAAALASTGSGESGMEELAEVAKRWLLPPRVLVTISGPNEEEGLTETWDAADLKPAAIEGRTKPTSDDGKAEILPNGLVLAVHTEPSSDVFAVHVLARNRSALEPERRQGLADLVQRLLLRGTLAHDAVALEESLGAIGANAKFFDDPRFPFDDYYTTPLYSFARVEARSDRATDALRLLAEILQTPRFDPGEIARTVGEMHDLSVRDSESSRARASLLFRGLVAPGNMLARSVVGNPARLEGVTREEVVQMYARLFAPENLIVTVRSGGSRDALLRQARAAFAGSGPGGAWNEQQPAPPEPTSRPSAPVPGTERHSPTKRAAPPEVTTTPRRAVRELGKMQGYLIMGGVIEVDSRDLPALGIANLILSGRLQMDLRERQGLAYSLGSGIEDLGMGRVLLSIAMGTAPGNLDHAESEIVRITNELRAGPLEEAEVARVVAARTGRILMRRLPSMNQAYYDGLRLFEGRPTEGNLEFLAAMKQATAPAVQEVVRKYFHPDTWCVGIVR